MMVLVVEDDPAQRLFLVRYLERRGYAVTEASTVAEAKSAQRADVIIADWNLPDGTAQDLTFGLPLIVLSGYEKPADWPGYWVVKPRYEELPDVLTKALAQAGL